MIVDEVLMAIGILMAICLYSGVFLADHPRARAYVRENMGAPFVVAFIALLVTAAVAYSMGMQGMADELSEFAYFAILIGVVLQAVSLRGSKA